MPRLHRREYTELELILAYIGGVVCSACVVLPFLLSAH
jgi:hypothetical protein